MDTDSPLIWHAGEVGELMQHLPSVPLAGHVTKRMRRALRKRESGAVAARIAALRVEGKTWAEVAQAMGRSHSGVRAIYEQHGGADGERLDDETILANLRAFIAERGEGRVSRRAYQAWSRKEVAAATVENRFGSWTDAMLRARCVTPLTV